MSVLHHRTSQAAHKQVLFKAPAEGGHWRLHGVFDQRQDLVEVKKNLTELGWLTDVVISDDDPNQIVKTLHDRARAMHAAGLGPDRKPPAVSSPHKLSPEADKILKDRRKGVNRPKNAPQRVKSPQKAPQKGKNEVEITQNAPIPDENVTVSADPPDLVGSPQPPDGANDTNDTGPGTGT